jgi:hypothetical protein
MDGLQLRDEAAQDRVRAATEFLDPSIAKVERVKLHARKARPTDTTCRAESANNFSAGYITLYCITHHGRFTTT